jgi:hypothetical protein
MQILGDQGFRCPAFALQATAGRQVSEDREQKTDDRKQMTDDRRPPFAQRASEGRQMSEGRKQMEEERRQRVRTQFYSTKSKGPLPIVYNS